MNNLFLRLILVILPAFSSINSLSQTNSEDLLARIENLLIKENVQSEENGERIAEIALKFIGYPQDLSYRTDSSYSITGIHPGFTPLGFINTVQAIASASKSHYPSIAEFNADMIKYACRKGTDDGFNSIMWHGSDWISDNVYRGNLIELTERYPESAAKTRSLDYMTLHRDEFAPLKNDDIYDKVEMTELGFRSHRLPYLKRQHIVRKDIVNDLRDGDILMLLSNDESKDIFLVGYVVNKDDKKYLACINPVSGQVIIEKEPLDRMFKLYAKHFFGFRWLRWQ